MEIQTNLEKIERIKGIIKDLQEIQVKLELNNYLLSLSNKTPIIVSCSDEMGKYRYLSEPIHLYDPGIIIYPFWVELECTYPAWSKDPTSFNIVKYDDFKKGKGYETLINSLVQTLEIDLSQARNFIRLNDLYLPMVWSYDLRLGSNLQVDFDKSYPVDEYSGNFYMKFTDDANMVMNTIEVKYLLVISYDYELNSLDELL